MKKYIVTILFSLLVVLVFVARLKAAKQAAAPRTKIATSLSASLHVFGSLPPIAIGPEPTPCPPGCPNFTKK